MLSSEFPEALNDVKCLVCFVQMPSYPSIELQLWFDLADISSCIQGQPWGVQASPVLLPVPQMLTQISLSTVTAEDERPT